MLAELDYRDSAWSDHEAIAEAILSGNSAAAERAAKAQAEEPSFEVRYVRSVKTEFFRFLLLGIEHIFTGYDHICFLIGLLLLGGSLKRLIGIVTDRAPAWRRHLFRQLYNALGGGW